MTSFCLVFGTTARTTKLSLCVRLSGHIRRLHPTIYGVHVHMCVCVCVQYGYLLRDLGRAEQAMSVFSNTMRLRKEVIGSQHIRVIQHQVRVVPAHQ